MPDWTIPGNLQELVDSDEGSIWEDTRWEPVLLTVMGGTSYGGRAIRLAWQIEFQPDDELHGQTGNLSRRAVILTAVQSLRRLCHGDDT